MLFYCEGIVAYECVPALRQHMCICACPIMLSVRNTFFLGGGGGWVLLVVIAHVIITALKSRSEFSIYCHTAFRNTL